jgi:caffeoyl-CoA O-methyltransferase
VQLAACQHAGMSPFLSETLDTYLDAHATALEPLLAENHDETYASLSSPQMIAGPVLGRLLRLLVWLAAPRLVVEIGTFSGYSAMAMAGGLPPEGRLVTCELSPERAEFARSYFDRSPWADRIEVRVGPALESVAALDGPFDFVFIDADKEGYPDYYDAVVPKLSPRGVIAVDNTLNGGGVADPRDDRDRMMAAFNDHVMADERTESLVLSVRDGVTLIRLASGPDRPL